jgi:hypothetical protein
MPMINTALKRAIEHCVTIMAICAIWMPNRSQLAAEGGGEERGRRELIKVQDDDDDESVDCFLSP